MHIIKFTLWQMSQGLKLEFQKTKTKIKLPCQIQSEKTNVWNVNYESKLHVYTQFTWLQMFQGLKLEVSEMHKH
jgi:hypothetical protein